MLFRIDGEYFKNLVCSNNPEVIQSVPYLMNNYVLNYAVPIALFYPRVCGRNSKLRTPKNICEKFHLKCNSLSHSSHPNIFQCRNNNILFACKCIHK